MRAVAVPGQSLTDKQGSQPWEKAPQVVDPKEAIALHKEHLNKEETMMAILDAIELGIDIKTITEGITRSAVAQGIHSIDTSMIVQPVIHEIIKGNAEAAGISYEEGFENKEETEKRNEEVKTAKLQKLMEDL